MNKITKKNHLRGNNRLWTGGRQLKAFFLTLLFAFAGLTACDSLQKDVTIDLPHYEPEIVVECYLEHGKPYRLFLTESANYFGEVDLPSLPNVKVSITHNGAEEILTFNPGYDSTTQKFYTYAGTTIVDSAQKGDYALKIEDEVKGRIVTGVTSFLPAPRLDTIEVKFRDKDSLAFVLTKFQDNHPNDPNYYRIIVNKDSLAGDVVMEFSLEGRFKTDNQIALGTGYDFKDEDTVFVSVFHLQKDYYDFLETVEDAKQANGNPFAQPTVVKSTVEGGLGVFTTLAYFRRRLVLEKD